MNCLWRQSRSTSTSNVSSGIGTVYRASASASRVSRNDNGLGFDPEACLMVGLNYKLATQLREERTDKRNHFSVSGRSVAVQCSISVTSNGKFRGQTFLSRRWFTSDGYGNRLRYDFTKIPIRRKLFLLGDAWRRYLLNLYTLPEPGSRSSFPSEACWEPA